MTSPSAGIQQLLAAEKKAADKVGEARKRKHIYDMRNFSYYMSCDGKLFMQFLNGLLNEKVLKFLHMTP